MAGGFQCVWLGSAALQHNCILSVKYFLYTQPTLPVQGLPGVHSQQCECLPLEATYVLSSLVTVLTVQAEWSTAQAPGLDRPGENLVPRTGASEATERMP